MLPTIYAIGLEVRIIFV